MAIFSESKWINKMINDEEKKTKSGHEKNMKT